MSTKVATAVDLKAIIKDAKYSPTELERLVNDPDEVLADRGLMTSPNAVAFLRSMGQSKYDETMERAKEGDDVVTPKTGET